MSVLANLRRNHFQHRAISNMHDQRIPAGPFLRHKNLLDRARIERIRPQTVDRLRRKRHRTAAAQDPRCPRNRSLRSRTFDIPDIHREPQRLHCPSPEPYATTREKSGCLQPVTCNP